MENSKIYWKKAIEFLKSNNKISQVEIDFNNEQIPVRDVAFLNKQGIRVPENLVFYDDENIDCSDIPEITDKDINEGKIQWIINAEIPLDSEISNWIKIQNIDINQLTTQLIKNFYQTMKNIQKNAAL